LLGLFVALQAPSVWGQQKAGAVTELNQGSGILLTPTTIISKGSVGLKTCPTNQILKSTSGTAPGTWVCAADDNSGGDITAVTTAAGSGLTGGATSGDVTLAADFMPVGGDNGTGTGDGLKVARGNHMHDLSYVKLGTSLTLPLDGLHVGASQLHAASGKVGVGTSSPIAGLDVRDFSILGAGGNAGEVFRAIGGSGGDSSIEGGTGGFLNLQGGTGGFHIAAFTHAGGVGALVQLLGGKGGHFGGGDGGDANIIAGNGGAASNGDVGGNGGSIKLTVGAGGAGFSAGKPGKVVVTGGDLYLPDADNLDNLGGIIMKSVGGVCVRITVHISGGLPVIDAASVTCP